jgi:hypothetical protein
MGVNSSGPYRGFEKLLAYVKPGAINDQETLNYQIARLEAVVREKGEALSNSCNSYGWKALLKCYQIRDKICRQIAF